MQLQVQVSDKAYDLGEHLVDFVAALKKALDDGFQLMDLFPIAKAALADLAPAIQDASAASQEAQTDLRPFLNGISQSGLDLAFVFLGGKAQAQEPKKALGWLSIVQFLISAAPQLVALVQQLIAALSAKSREEADACKKAICEALEKGGVEECEKVLKAQCALHCVEC